MSDFFTIHEQKTGTNELRLMHEAYQLALKKIVNDFSFVDFTSLNPNFLEVYVNLFDLNKLRDAGVSDDKLLLIVRNIMYLMANAGTLKALTLLGIIQTGGNAVIFNEPVFYNGQIQYNGTRQYGSFIITNDNAIIFVEGDYLITINSGTGAIELKEIVEYFKSHRDFVQII